MPGDLIGHVATDKRGGLISCHTCLSHRAPREPVAEAPLLPRLVDNRSSGFWFVLADSLSSGDIPTLEASKDIPVHRMGQTEEPSLDIERHLRYWKMCLRSPLPSIYLSNDGNRMALAYFIINAIAILTPPATEQQCDSEKPAPRPLITPEERAKLRKWVLAHQHPGGGFSGSMSLVFPLDVYDEWDFETKSRSLEHSGLANIAATLFALQLLALLADDENAGDAFKGVDRKKTLQWLRRLQREDGSFGEALRRLPNQGWYIAGGYDMRYCYIAASIRWILRGDVETGDSRWVEDIDVGGACGLHTA